MAVNTTSRNLYNPKTGVRIKFGKGIEGANEFEGLDHYHIYNDSYTNKKIGFYFNIKGTTAGKGTKASPIIIKGESHASK